MHAIPRIKARVGEVEPGQGHDGEFCFEVLMFTMSNKFVGHLGTFGPYKTEKEAQAKMREATKMICQKIELDETGKTSDEYLDLKNGAEMRKWDEQ